MVRKTTTRDSELSHVRWARTGGIHRVDQGTYAALRRFGSGSFTVDQIVHKVSSRFHKDGVKPPKQLAHYMTDSIHRLAQDGYMVRRPGDPRRFKPQHKFNAITRRAQRALAQDASDKEVGDFYDMDTGRLRAVPKRVVYNLCLTLMEANTREEREGALVERVNAEVQAAGSEDRPLRAGTTAQQGAGLPGDALDTHMEVDEGENPFLDDNAGVAPSFLPETPQRVQQFGSYPTPPSTVLPLARQLPSAPVVQGTPSGTATGEAAVQGQRIDDMLDHAATTVATEESREEHRTQIATLTTENSALAGERDFYQKKHFVTAVALKGSQLQVEKLDKEGAGLFGNIVHSLGLSRWAPQRW